MKRAIQVRITRGEGQFVAECLDFPVLTQAATLEEPALNIHEAIGLHIEGEDLSELGFQAVAGEPLLTGPVTWGICALLFSLPFLYFSALS